MTYPQFRELVARMRKAQKEFFRTHAKSALQNSMSVEKEVDRILEDFETPPQQVKLFNDETDDGKSDN